jgi:hypothetical protein
MSNYPDGVSDSHPYFNPPLVSASAVECGAEEAKVIPSHAIKAVLYPTSGLCEHYARHATDPKDAAKFTALGEKLTALIEEIKTLEQEREYECPFTGEIDLEESECARWDCPVCGNERETDTLPEERDPDEAWDRRGDDD